MAVRTKPNPVLLAIDKYARLRGALRGAERAIERFLSLGNGATSRDVIDGLLSAFSKHRAGLSSLMRAGGDIYAVAQFVNGKGYDGAVEWPRALAAIDAAAAWIKDNYPAVDGVLQERTLGRDGKIEYIVLPREFQQGLAVELDKVLATLRA